MDIGVVNAHLCYLLGTLMYDDIGEPGFVQSNGSGQTSNTGPDYDNLEVRDFSFQVVLQVSCPLARPILKDMPSKVLTADANLVSMLSNEKWRSYGNWYLMANYALILL
jgi:hypothetical protein